MNFRELIYLNIVSLKSERKLSSIRESWMSSSPAIEKHAKNLVGIYTPSKSLKSSSLTLRIYSLIHHLPLLGIRQDSVSLADLSEFLFSFFLNCYYCLLPWLAHQIICDDLGAIKGLASCMPSLCQHQRNPFKLLNYHNNLFS